MKSRLEKIFPGRVSFDLVERMLYSHDVANLPAAVEKMVLKTADAVVQPVSTEEIVELVRYAREKKIPLVPRGAATSGYGGVIPIKGGIVVAFTRMNKVLGINKEKKTVTVQPGVIWEKLEQELQKEGLSLRLYPSSAPGATVGGWLAQGGSGIGSFEYGFIGDNIVEAKVVIPSGEVKTFKGEEIVLINQAEGITGFIVEVTLPVRDLSEEKLILAAFDDFRRLVATIKEITAASLPVWHISFSTADFIKNKVDAVETASQYNIEGVHAENREITHPPHGKHLLMVVYPGSRENIVADKLVSILNSSGGEILPDKVAQHEWSERFYTMRVKNLGPSLIPSEAIIPLDTIADVVEEAGKKLEGISIEGSLVKKDSVTLLAFLTGDERTAAYNIGFAKSLVMMEIAKAHGGRTYSTGLYFTDEAEEALGKDVFEKMSAYKKAVDPDNIFNPGKVLSSTGNPVLLRTAMKAARATEPLLNIAEKFLSDKPKVKKRLAEVMARASFACAQCGYCVDTCTLNMGFGWESSTPRGKWYILREYLKGNLQLDQKTVDMFLMCTTCKRCNPVCQVNLPIMELWDAFRPMLVNDMGFSTYNGFEMMAASVESDLNIWAGRRNERDAWIPKDIEIKDKAEIAYWAGCTASLVTTNTAVGAARILKEAGVEFTTLGKDEGCCGTPMLVAGKLDTFEFIFRNNIEGLLKRGVKEIVISCPGCYMAFAHQYPIWAKKLGYPYEFKLKHISEKTEELIKEGKLKFKKPVNKRLTWHDSCHIGRHSGIYDAPRNVLKSIPGVEFVEMEHHREDALCCGSVLTRIAAPPVADKLGDMRVQEAVDVKADAMIATCPCCEVQLRASAKHAGKDMPILDFTDFILEALGYEYQDSSEYTLYMWSVFEKALEIMTVDGIVDMMADMMPEIMAAMPSSMQPMMKGMESLPGPVQGPALAMMEKMIPTLMPMLLPQMMPKLMPKVLELMKQYIPHMPVQMEEKLPTMLPKVMEKIMPAMLPQVAPKLAPKMTEYMKNAKTMKKAM
ncbi:FAD-binding and (Fe-S)-binding domain-containing protein [Thermincola potens]|uniref:FAD linked oxidase domain protein n=1 Tax=Thermincola potens (strain JR) TaxID=635013 RepID=D5XEL5_THEPJ|nr:FAD-binding and (Fe-S)-binding domain-containing protein [Thermincola potens]ADG82086.1 FAD linked oxidase domain protein [Thermincola potens JR]